MSPHSETTYWCQLDLGNEGSGWETLLLRFPCWKLSLHQALPFEPYWPNFATICPCLSQMATKALPSASKLTPNRFRPSLSCIIKTGWPKGFRESTISKRPCPSTISSLWTRKVSSVVKRKRLKASKRKIDLSEQKIRKESQCHD